MAVSVHGSDGLFLPIFFDENFVSRWALSFVSFRVQFPFLIVIHVHRIMIQPFQVCFHLKCCVLHSKLLFSFLFPKCYSQVSVFFNSMWPDQSSVILSLYTVFQVDSYTVILKFLRFSHHLMDWFFIIPDFVLILGTSLYRLLSSLSFNSCSCSIRTSDKLRNFPSAFTQIWILSKFEISVPVHVCASYS